MTTAYVTHPRYADHHLAGHPEHAGRIRAVWQRLETAGLIARLHSIEATPAPDEALLALHTLDYLALLDDIAGMQYTARIDSDTYVNPGSPAIARLSAGGVIAAVDAVMRGEASNALAAVRPPGHHAMPHIAMGFCLFGNIAIAARHAQHTYGIERVMIIDIDVHHGNGTEAMFYDDPSVLFVSTHQYPLYPGTGKITDTGTGAGEGYTLNIAMPPGFGNAGYAAVMESTIWPMAERFQPELVLVSAGFDAHWLDPLGGMRLTISGYAQLTRECMRIAERYASGRIAVVMEGGYNLDALSYGMCGIAQTLLGEPVIDDPLGAPDARLREPDIRPIIDVVKAAHRL